MVSCSASGRLDPKVTCPVHFGPVTARFLGSLVPWDPSQRVKVLKTQGDTKKKKKTEQNEAMRRELNWHNIHLWPRSPDAAGQALQTNQHWNLICMSHVSSTLGPKWASNRPGGNNKVGNPIRIFPVSAPAQPHPKPYSEPISAKTRPDSRLGSRAIALFDFHFWAKHNSNRSYMPVPLPIAKKQHDCYKAQHGISLYPLHSW